MKSQTPMTDIREFEYCMEVGDNEVIACSRASKSCYTGKIRSKIQGAHEGERLTGESLNRDSRICSISETMNLSLRSLAIADLVSEFANQGIVCFSDGRNMAS